MREETDSFQMGWNDILGNLRQAFGVTELQKKDWCKKQRALAESGASFGLQSQNNDEYRKGVIAACDTHLAAKKMAYRGPRNIIQHLESLEPNSTTG